MKLNNFAYFDNIVVNLEQTSTIKFSENNKKIVFSFFYTIKKLGNTIPDSFYVENFTKENLKFLDSEYFKENFIEYSQGRYLNKNAIATLRYNKNKGVIIFNLNHLHTYNKSLDGGECEKVEMPEYAYMQATYEEYLNLLK